MIDTTTPSKLLVQKRYETFKHKEDRNQKRWAAWVKKKSQSSNREIVFEKLQGLRRVCHVPWDGPSQ